MLNALGLPKLSNKSRLKESWRVRNKKLFPDTIMDKIFETKSNLHGKYEKSATSIFQELFASSKKKFHFEKRTDH